MVGPWSSQNTPSICWLCSPSDGHGLWCPKTITTDYWSEVTIAHIIIKMFKILRDSPKCEADTTEQMPLGLLEAGLPQPSACRSRVTRLRRRGVPMLGSWALTARGISHLLYSLLRLFLCEADCFFACFQCVCHCSSKHFCHCLVCHTHNSYI